MKETLKKTNDLTIIITTFNSDLVIEKCLKSFSINNYDVFIIDNNSSDNTIEIINKNFSSVNIIKNNKNLGFGRANNIGLKQAKTPFALILNPDTEIRDSDIETSLNNLKNNPQIALASPKIIGSTNFDDSQIDNNNPIIFQHFIVGGVMFMNLEIIKKIGFFNEEYFLFAEDSEICDNAILAGYQNAIFNNAIAIHHGGSSSKKSLRVVYRRFWHLGWSKTKYKKGRKNLFNLIRSTLRLSVIYFFEGFFYLLRGNLEKSVGKFAFSFGCTAYIIGLKAFDNNDNPRG